MKNLKYT